MFVNRFISNRARLNRSVAWPLLFITLLSAISSSALAQSADREKPKLKDFGSSVKKLKWDPEKNQTSERNVSGGRSTDDDVVTIETSLVACDILVLDKQGHTVQGLKQSDFKISENGTPQEVGHFFLGDNASLPRSIVLIIDYSGSQFPYIKNSVDAAKLLVDKLGPNDSMAIVTDDVEMIVDFTRDKGALKRKLDSLLEKSKGSKGFLGFSNIKRQLGKSAQYSALMATLMEAFNAEDQRPIIVFQTDGDEAFYLRNPIVIPTLPPNLPPDLKLEAQMEVEARKKLQHDGLTEFSLDDVYRTVEKSRATIYTVVPGFKLIGLSQAEQVARVKADDERRISSAMSVVGPKVREAFKKREEERQKKLTPEILQQRAEESVKIQAALAEVATLSGGWTEFLEEPSQAQTIYSKIFADISQRYIIGYYPTNKEHDGKRRMIGFEVKGHPEYTIIGRRSYLAPGP
jgi:VWFA-related protein